MRPIVRRICAPQVGLGPAGTRRHGQIVEARRRFRALTARLNYFTCGCTSVESRAAADLLHGASVEGTFQWTGGDPFVYTNWSSREPNNFNSNEANSE